MLAERPAGAVGCEAPGAFRARRHGRWRARGRARAGHPDRARADRRRARRSARENSHAAGEHRLQPRRGRHFGQPLDPGRRQGAAQGVRRASRPPQAERRGVVLGSRARHRYPADAPESRQPNTASSARAPRGSISRASSPAGRAMSRTWCSRACCTHASYVLHSGFKRLLSVEEPKNAKLVRDGNFLGVLAEREEDAIAAAAKLCAKCTWEAGPRVPDDIHAWLKEHVAEHIVSKENADPAAAARGARRVKAAYTKPYIAHASIAPRARSRAGARASSRSGPRARGFSVCARISRRSSAWKKNTSQSRMPKGGLLRPPRRG